MSVETKNQKPNYWKMSKDEKSLFLSKNGLTKYDAITKYFILHTGGLVALVLGLFFLIASLTAQEGALLSGIFWTIGGAIVLVIGLGILIWSLVESYRNKQGIFISQYESGNESLTKRYTEAIKEDMNEIDPEDKSFDL